MSVLPIILLLVLGISWGLRVSLLKVLAQSGMPFVHVLFSQPSALPFC